MYAVPHRAFFAFYNFFRWTVTIKWLMNTSWSLSLHLCVSRFQQVIGKRVKCNILSLWFQQTLPLVFVTFLGWGMQRSICELMWIQQFHPSSYQSNREQRCFEKQHCFPNKMPTTRGSDLNTSPLEQKNRDVTVAWQPLQHKTFSINSKSFATTIVSFMTVGPKSRLQNLPMLTCNRSDTSESNLQL